MTPTAALFHVLAATAGAPTNFQHQFGFAFTGKDGEFLLVTFVLLAAFFGLKAVGRAFRRGE